jgi:hypothetical protein
MRFDQLKRRELIKLLGGAGVRAQTKCVNWIEKYELAMRAMAGLTVLEKMRGHDHE